jgi:hypothetical protein
MIGLRLAIMHMMLKISNFILAGFIYPRWCVTRQLSVRRAIRPVGQLFEGESKANTGELEGDKRQPNPTRVQG